MRDIDFIAHRGASHEAPENTLASFRLAWETGADGIEGDFRFTRDRQIVCLHDATTGRTAGIDITVADSTLDRLRELDVGAWKGDRWSGERIPTLREVIATIPPGKKFFIELKSGPDILIPMAAVLADSGLDPGQVAICAFSEELIAASRNLFPHIKRLWITDYTRDWRRGGWSPSVRQILRILENIGACGLASRAHRALDAAFVRALRAAGMELHVWTVDNPRTAARFLALGVDSIITNRPDWLRARLHTLSSRD